MFKKILVGTDFSDGSKHAAEVAVDLAKALGATVTLAHAWAPPVYPRPAGDAFAADPVLLQSLEDAVRAELDAQQRALAGRGVDISSRGLLGPEADALVHLAAAEGFDLVVVGTHGRTGFKRLVLGSFAERLVRTSPVPVLTVRHPS